VAAGLGTGTTPTPREELTMTQSTPTVSSDLDAIIDLTEARLPLKHPKTGAELTAYLVLAGPEHPLRKKLVFERQRTLRGRMQKTGEMHIEDPEEEAQVELEHTAACIVGWGDQVSGSGVITLGGRSLTYSPGAVSELMARAWIREQARAGLRQRDLFIADSATA
jgi:hypothetical protein